MTIPAGQIDWSRRTAWVFSLPWIGTAFVLTPLSMVMPAFYAAHAGLSLSALAVATALSRILDAVVDPMVGHLSDRTRSRLGPRRPWVAGGTVALCLAVWQLFQPPADAGIAWFVGWTALLYVGLACIETPMRAWGSELTRDITARARLFTQVGVARALGSLAFWFMPLLALLLAGTARLDDPRTLAIAAVALALVMPALVGVTLTRTPQPETDTPVEAPAPFLQFLRDARGNRPLLWYVASYGLWSLSSGAATAVTFIFLGSYLGLGDSLTALLAVFFVVQIVAMPWWVKLLKRVDKHHLLAGVWLLDAALKPLLLLFSPGEPIGAAMWLLLVAMAITGSVSYGIPHAVLADIIDLDTLRSRRPRAASFFALGTLLYKAAFGLGGSLALYTLAAGGYDVALGGATALAATPDAGTPWAIVWAVVLIPAALLVAAAALMWQLPLNAQQHAVIVRRLNQRARRGMMQDRAATATA